MDLLYSHDAIGDFHEGLRRSPEEYVEVSSDARGEFSEVHVKRGAVKFRQVQRTRGLFRFWLEGE